MQLSVYNKLLLHLDFPTLDLLELVVSRENACRYCYSATRMQLRMLGMSEARMQELEQRLARGDVEPKAAAAVQFARRMTRAIPLATPRDLEPLRATGHSEAEIREMLSFALERGGMDPAKLAGLAHHRNGLFAAWERAGELWDHDPGQWLADPDYILWAKNVVESRDFWRNNYLSTDFRIPISLVRTNAGRAMATNAITGSMWQDFASEDYRNLPSVGPIRFWNPYLGPEGGEDMFTPRHATKGGAPAGGGGPGYYRVPTLISIWATAPLLHNNSLGRFTNDPSGDEILSAVFFPAHRRRQGPQNPCRRQRSNPPRRRKRTTRPTWNPPRCIP